MVGWRLVLVGVVVLAVACGGGGSHDDADQYCDAVEAFLVDGEVPATTMLAPEAIRQDLDFLLSQNVLPFGTGGAGDAIDEAEARYADYLVDECGIDRELVEPDESDGFFD